MCGIAGIVNLRGNPVEPAEISRLTSLIAHRGPFGEGTWFNAKRNVAFGHRRLAIIDPGEGGYQPMVSGDGRHVIVYNGEIYNFLELRRELEANIARRLTPHPVKIRADVEVSCFGYEGIDAVKQALRAGEELSTEAIPIKIKLVAPPLYVLVTHSTDKQGGIALLEQALEKITESIEKSDGKVTIKMKPKTVSAVEDEELAQLMARVEKENTEVQGDDDSEDEED